MKEQEEKREYKKLYFGKKNLTSLEADFIISGNNDIFGFNVQWCSLRKAEISVPLHPGKIH